MTTPDGLRERAELLYYNQIVFPDGRPRAAHRIISDMEQALRTERRLALESLRDSMRRRAKEDHGNDLFWHDAANEVEEFMRRARAAQEGSDA